MKTIATVIGFALGCYGLVLADFSSTSEALRMFIGIFGGYIYGRIFP
jgi:hypothetical protein